MAVVGIAIAEVATVVEVGRIAKAVARVRSRATTIVVEVGTSIQGVEVGKSHGSRIVVGDVELTQADIEAGPLRLRDVIR